MSSDHVSDEEVMQLVVRQGSGPLEILVRRYATPLLTFLHRLVGDLHRAEELFQEVFLLVWTKRESYEYPRVFKSWLYTIAINASRAVYRKRRLGVVSLDHQPDPADETAPSERMSSEETAHRIQQAVGRLPPQQREVVTLRIWEELPYSRIGEMVGCSEGTVRSHMHHALASLRSDLAGLALTEDI